MSDIDFQIYDVENELEKRREKENLSQTRTASGSKTGCLMSIIYFVAGIALLRIISELLSNL
jgi:hypothetical protein